MRLGRKHERVTAGLPASVHELAVGDGAPGVCLESHPGLWTLVGVRRRPGWETNRIDKYS